MITFDGIGGPLVLRSPDLGDSDSHNIKSRFRRAMSGKIFAYKKTPADSVLLMRWNHLNVTDRANLITFLKANIAQTITLTLDYLGLADPAAITQEWSVVCITDPFEFETTGRHGDTCIEISTITLQFRGVRTT